MPALHGCRRIGRTLAGPLVLSNAAWMALIATGTQAQDRDAVAASVAARAADVAASPDRFVGQRVRIEDAWIDTVLTARRSVLTVEAGSQTLLVAIPYAAGEPELAPRRTVTLTGRVWQTAPALIVAWPALNEDWSALAPFADKPLIVADSVQSRRGDEIVNPPPTVDSVSRLVTSVDAAGLVDREVELTAVDVEEVLSPRSFEARGPDGYTVIVEVPGGDAAGVRAGDTVKVKGIVRLQATAIYPWSVLPEAGTSFLARALYVEASEVEPAAR